MTLASDYHYHAMMDMSRTLEHCHNLEQLVHPHVEHDENMRMYLAYAQTNCQGITSSGSNGNAAARAVKVLGSLSVSMWILSESYQVRRLQATYTGELYLEA